MPIVKCDYCGKEFERDAYHLSLYKKHYCCDKCRLKSFNQPVKVKCAFCGKTIYISKNRFESKKCKRYFCNKECFLKQIKKEKEQNKEKVIERVRSYNRAYYHAHPELKEARKIYTKTSKFRLKAMGKIELYKKRNIENLKKENLITDCIICGYSKEKFEAIEFHHVNPETKEYNISNLLRKCSDILKKDKYIEEIKKCVCMCANCHRLYHANYEEVVKKYNKIIKEKGFE